MLEGRRYEIIQHIEQQKNPPTAVFNFTRSEFTQLNDILIIQFNFNLIIHLSTQKRFYDLKNNSDNSFDVSYDINPIIQEE